MMIYSESKMRSDGRCGPNFLLPDETLGQCDGYSTRIPCCSSGGWCGHTYNHCKCTGCIDYTISEYFEIRYNSSWCQICDILTTQPEPYLQGGNTYIYRILNGRRPQTTLSLVPVKCHPYTPAHEVYIC